MNATHTPPHIFVFVGRSGSGKGTQLELLADYIKRTDSREQYKLNMGGMFRNFFQSGLYVAQIANDLTTNQGKFQPDFITTSLFVHDAITHISNEQHLFIDGYPRTQAQAEVLLELLAYARLGTPTVIDIDVSGEEARKRMMLRGRNDDSAEKIDSRFSEYERTVVPMIEWMKTNPNLSYVKVDGMSTPEAIHEALKQVLKI